MNNAMTVYDEMPIMELGNVLVKSGFFADSRDASQAIVKVLAGRELGFGAIASMTGVNIIKGRVSLSANLIAAAIKRTQRYNYRVAKMTDKECEVIFYEAGQEVGRSSFTAEDAKRAGLTGDNWTKYPRNMLFARAISNGAKWYCPDVFGGPVYLPDELGAVVDGETGEVIDVQATEPAKQNGNGHAVEVPQAEDPGKLEVAWAAWYKLVEKAAGVGVFAEDPAETATVDELRAAYKALSAQVKAKEA